ncbi:dienelactone hydrolase family protein [Ammoniphilus sp. YIM 78166]|uniref:dienelactone hydrolase family protein n=1 Tax=Ammoniphilus sp. YIM 78166 TaxID=1644106 RepID=UPI00142FC3B4|nr:dienelactone hydrolase family protein [Ammoniphilus sp. YIM 78166]
MIQQNVQTSQVKYGSFHSVLCKPTSPGCFPSIITIHGIYGLQEMDVLFAQRLALQGYMVLAHGWQTEEKDPADRKIVMGIREAIDFLKQQDQVNAQHIGLIGVCRGGSIAMIAGAHIEELKMSVSFYGQAYYPLNDKKPASPIDLVNQVTMPMLLIHGEEDIIFDAQETIDFYTALQTRGKKAEYRLYPEAGHGFFLKGHRNYHRQASEDAWIVLSQFLNEHLPT